jgi:8-oxo-dGTP diphosphatase
VDVEAGEAEVVRAAGGLVLRSGGSGTEVLLVHRPAYDDWSFPKGKAAGGESDADCALREVEEETGLRCEILEPIGETRYRDGRDRPKVVRYFSMRALDGAFAAHREIDDARWLPVEAALDWLTYEHDRELLRAFVARS